MTRGKHAARRAARDQRAAASLADHVQRARDRLEQAQQRQLALRDLEQQLHQETAVLQDQSREREAQLWATARALTVKVGDLEQAMDDLDDAWRKLSRKVSGRLGSWHALSSLLNGTPTLATSSLDGVHPNAPAAVLRAHARGHLPPDYTGTISPLTWFADWLPEPAHIVGSQLRHIDPLTVRGVHHEVDLPEHLATSVTRVGPLMDAVAASTIDTLEPYCLAAWQPLPWLASGTYTPGTARDQTHQPSTTQTALGALDRLDPDESPTRQEPSDAVRKRGREWLAEQRHIRARGRLATPWAPRPIFFRPLDAEALRCWYRRDALCDWASASTLAATLRDLHDQNPELGEPDELRGEIALAQRLTQELDQAALYWLPPGHTAAHAGSEPLNGDALPELRLPYSSVLLTFADPLALPPANAAAGDVTYRGKLVRARRSVPEHNQAPTWRDWTATTVYTPADADRNGAFPHLRELLDHQGAFVEAVLLFADPEGRPRDLFAWCLAIPDTETGQILARTVLAASLSRTAYADVIHNLIAVVGWAEWHPPHHVTGPAAATSRVGNSRAEHDPRDGVYVLRAGRGATWIRTSAGDPTSRTGRVRPHRRRGHWRRQHHGPGNQLLKWVRIAPTIVNAHAGPLSPQIYRLPPPPGTKS